MNRFSTTCISLVLLLLALAGGCSKPPGQAEYDRGLYELKRNNAVRAKARLEKSISQRPGAEENALAYNYLGVANWKLGQFQPAQEAFEDSRRLAPRLVEPVLNLAALALSGGDPARAIKLLDEASRLDVQDSRALEQMAHLFIARQQWVEARRMLYAALERSPGSPRIYTALAQVELKAQDPQKALETLLQALEHNARYAPALFNMALIYDQNLRDAPHARSYYRRFLGVLGSGPYADYARQAMARLDAPATPPKAEVAPVLPALPMQEDVPPVVAVPIPATITGTPVVVAPPPPPEDPVKDVERRAVALLEKGDTAGGLDLLLAAAASAQEARRTADQEKYLQSAVRLCFDEPRAHLEWGKFLLARNNTEAALRALKQATTLDRNFTEAHVLMARVALQAGEYDAALVGLQSAVKADPKNPEWLWELAQLLDSKLKNPERASETYREFERLFPGDARIQQAATRARELAATIKPPAPPPAVTRPPPPSITAPKPGTLAPPVVVTSRAPAEVVAPAPRAPAPPTKQLTYKAPLNPNPRSALLAFNQGLEFQRQGQGDRAIYYYLRSLENDDRVGTTFYNLGGAYAARGERELAKDAYLRALQLDPSLNGARYNLALLYFQSGDTTSAQGLLLEVVQRDGNYAAAYYTLGMIYAATPATLGQAKEAYRRYLELAPRDPAAAAVREWLSRH